MSEYFEKHAQRQFSKGTVIFKEGDLGFSMFIIQQGEVEVTTTIDKREIILARLEEGSIFGEMALLGDAHRSATITATKDTVCLEINKLLFNKQMEAVPSWLRSFFKIIVERLKESNKKQKTLSDKDLSRQVVYLISDFLERVEENKSGQRQVPWLQTVEDIVFLLNLPKEQVEKVMNQLTLSDLAQSRIVFGNQRVLITDKFGEMKEFADFVKKRHFESMGHDLPEKYAGTSEEELHFLEFIDSVMKNQANATDLHIEELEAKCREMYHRDLSYFDRQFKDLTDKGILHMRQDADGHKYYIVDRDQMQKRLVKIEKIEGFKKLEGKLG